MVSMISRDQLDIRQHAAQRMLERGISVADVLTTPNSGATIEDYPDDMPLPSRLTLGWVDRLQEMLAVAARGGVQVEVREYMAA